MQRSRSMGRWIAVLLIVLMPLPAFESIEAIYAADHAYAGSDRPDGDGCPDDEHGCTALVHTCSCHGPALQAAAMVPRGPDLLMAQRPPAASWHAGLDSEAPPVPPPIG